ncbi:MAG: hypothetical protein ABI573_12160 [Chloroflexota bacterium]
MIQAIAEHLERRSTAFLIVLVAVVGAVGLYVGAGQARVFVHTAVPVSAPGAISVEADGWTYAIPLDGVRWGRRLEFLA